MENTEPAPRSAREYLLALAAVAGATGAGYIIRPWSDPWAVAVVYLFTIVLLGLRLGQGPILAAATLAALTWDYLFFPPLFSFLVERIEDWMMLGLFFAIALVTGRLTGRIRQQERVEQLRAQRATALYQLTRTLASAQSADEVLRKAAAQVRDLFGARLALLVAETSHSDRLVLHPSASDPFGAEDQAAAQEFFHAYRRTGTQPPPPPYPRSIFFPLAAGGRILGVMAVEAGRDNTFFPAHHQILDSFSTQIALALEHEQLRAANESARLQTASDRLHRALLDSVSHELNTPLAVIASAAEGLQASTSPAVLPLVQEIQVATGRLQRLVINLLDTTRLESGGLRAHLDWCDLGDLVNAVLQVTRDVRRGRQVHVQLPADLPLVRCDFDLLQQALTNLLHNACRHTPAAAEISISAGQEPGAATVWLAVADNGPGLRADQRAQLFERFYRGQPEQAGGLGLGLSIARGFVEAHGGTLEADNQPAGGARFVIRLPFAPHDTVPPE